LGSFHSINIHYWIICISKSYTSTTIYTITGTTSGCSKTATISVTVSSTPPTINAGSGVSICNGSSANLSATGGVTYTWSPSTGLSSTDRPECYGKSFSYYDIYCYGGTNGCSSTATKTVTVNASPSVSAGSSVAICNGGSNPD
jgi:hypothetical protein